MRIFQSAAVPLSKRVAGVHRRWLVSWRLRSVPIVEREYSVRSAKKRLQVWHYLIPIFGAFWIVVGVVLTISGLLVLGVIALAILAIFSFVIIMLARAFQNDV